MVIATTIALKMYVMITTTETKTWWILTRNMKLTTKEADMNDIGMEYKCEHWARGIGTN